MDFERVSLLVNIIHNTLNIPGTERIREEATKELLEINKAFADVMQPEPVAEPVAEATPVAEEPAADEPAQEEIKVGGRRL